MSSYSEYFHSALSRLDLVYTEGLSALGANSQSKENLSRLYDVLSELSNIERRSNLRTLWWYGSAFIECLIDEGIAPSKEAYSVCLRFHDLIHKMSQGQVFDRSSPELTNFLEILKNEINDATSSGSTTQEVKQFLSYRLKSKID